MKMIRKFNPSDPAQRSRRQFMLVAFGQLISAPVLATYSNSSSLLTETVSKGNSRKQHLNALGAFAVLGDDPHIQAAKSLAISELAGSKKAVQWKQLVKNCSGCEFSDQPAKILAGFLRRKNASLRNFQVKNIDGYMLTREEVILGQLLITA